MSNKMPIIAEIKALEAKINAVMANPQQGAAATRAEQGQYTEISGADVMLFNGEPPPSKQDARELVEGLKADMAALRAKLLGEVASGKPDTTNQPGDKPELWK